VGGSFNQYNGSDSRCIIRLGDDGSIDDNFMVGGGFDGSVSTIAPTLDGSGDIYVGGGFTSYNGIASNHILRLNSNGTVDEEFDEGTGFSHGNIGVIHGYYSQVSSIFPALDGSGNIYAGGSFNSYQDTTVLNIISLTPDGSIH
jgi:hypothetical protein